MILIAFEQGIECWQNIMQGQDMVPKNEVQSSRRILLSVNAASWECMRSHQPDSISTST